MAGRKRRGSTSSIEATDDRPTRRRAEASVLRPAPPETSDHPWPDSRTFELRDAVVLDQHGESVVNALDVLEKGPFVVRGTLMIDSADQKEHLLARVKSSVAIEIPTYTRFSIGDTVVGDDSDDSEEDDEGIDSRGPSPTAHIIWVGGQSGWYEINPAPEYVEIHRHIRDAIRLYYTLFDIYEEEGASKLNRLGKSSDPIERLAPVFLKYSVKVGDGSTVEDVAAKCDKLAGFLFSQFLDKPHNLAFWRKTHLYRWLKSNHEELYDKIWAALHRPLPQQQVPIRDKQATSSRNRSTRSRSVATDEAAVQNDSIISDSKRSVVEIAEADGARRRPTKPESTAPLKMASIPVAPRLVDTVESGSAQQSAFASVLEAVEFAMDAVAGSKNGITLQGVTTKLFASYSVPQYKSGQHGTTYKQPILDILHYNAAELLRHLDDSKYSESDFRNWLAQAAEKEFQPIALKSSDFPYHIFRRQSRPFQPRTLTRASNGNEDQSIMSAHTPSAPRGKGLKTPGRTPGKSSLRPITSSKKRYHEDLEDGSEADSPSLTKKSHYFNEIEEEDDDDENMEDAAPHDSLSSSDEEEPIKLVIRAEKLPSSMARGPHDTWTCDQENCDYIVRGEDQKECQERIQEHFANHENHSQRVQLAMTEGSRGHLPINHLLEKIQKLGQASQQKDRPLVNGVPVPDRIKRKMIA